MYILIFRRIGRRRRWQSDRRYTVKKLFLINNTGGNFSDDSVLLQPASQLLTHLLAKKNVFVSIEKQGMFHFSYLLVGYLRRGWSICFVFVCSLNPQCFGWLTTCRLVGLRYCGKDVCKCNNKHYCKCSWN